MKFALEFTEDPREFLAVRASLLEADPVLTTVVATRDGPGGGARTRRAAGAGRTRAGG